MKLGDFLTKLFFLCSMQCICMFFISCNQTTKTQEKVFVLSPTKGSTRVPAGSAMEFMYNAKKQADSITAYIGKQPLLVTYTNTNDFAITMPTNILGSQTVLCSLFYDGLVEHHTVYVTLLSDIIPTQTQVSNIKAFNHDKTAYTQGLEYHDGILYESTGLYGESTIRKVDLNTGNVLQSKKLPETVFGEGLTLVGDTLFQLTWKSQKGFMYSKHDLSEIGQFSYPTEGWGLAYDGEYLIMTDGSEYLYFYSLPHFTKITQIPVYDNQGAVRQLNELEYIDGFLYANIYTTDDIVKIDPKTGKIHQRISLSALLPPQYHHDEIDVLNGIAYDKENNRIFVTGKNWPKLFEVKF